MRSEKVGFQLISNNIFFLPISISHNLNQIKVYTLEYSADSNKLYLCLQGIELATVSFGFFFGFHIKSLQFFGFLPDLKVLSSKMDPAESRLIR